MRFSFWFCFDFFCGTVLVFFYVDFLSVLRFTYFVLFLLFLLRIRPVFPLRCVLVNNFHFSVNLWAFVCISLSKCLPFVPLSPRSSSFFPSLYSIPSMLFGLCISPDSLMMPFAIVMHSSTHWQTLFPLSLSLFLYSCPVNTPTTYAYLYTYHIYTHTHTTSLPPLLMHFDFRLLFVYN